MPQKEGSRHAAMENGYNSVHPLQRVTIITPINNTALFCGQLQGFLKHFMKTLQPGHTGINARLVLSLCSSYLGKSIRKPHVVQSRTMPSRTLPHNIEVAGADGNH